MSVIFSLIICLVPNYALTAAPTATVVSPPLIPEAVSSETRLRAILAGEHRSVANKARDNYRHPLETLLWFGLSEEMTVVEVLPSSGWYAEIIAPFLRQRGQYIGANFPEDSPSEFMRDTAKQFRSKLAAAPDLYGKALVTAWAPPGRAQLATPGVADRVLTFRNVHNWMKAGSVDAVFAAMFQVLKPGGILGIVEHRARNDQPQDPLANNGYVREDYVIQLAQRAGFRFLEASEINANSKDTKDYPDGVWTLPPTYALGEKNKSRYTAIGESDRMTLKFVKPDSATPTVSDLVRYCENNFSTRDQRTRMTIVNRNKEGKEKKGIYRRYTKNLSGQDALRQKMVLFAEYPPDSKGIAFMRWEYAAESEKLPDQWLFLPSLGNVRRISARDLAESFLGSILTLEDIGVRHVGQDTPRLVEIKPEGLSEVAWVEFVPTGESQYSKRLVKYVREGSTWESCVTGQIDYYDKKGLLQKRQELSWQKVQDVMVWKKVTVINTQSLQSSTFEIDDIRIDVAVEDELFTERSLRRGDRL